MAKPTIIHPRTALSTWTLVILLGFGGLAAGDYAMLRYATYLRSLDYASFVADAALAIDRKDFVSAQAALREAFRLAPDAPSPYVMKGHFHYHRQQWQAAVESYLKALELGSDDAGIQQNVVWAYIELEQFSQAAAFGEAAILKGNVGPRLPLYTGEALFRGGDYESAVRFLKAALALEPNNAYIMERLRVAYGRIGDGDAAKDMARKIAEINALVLEGP